MRKAKNIAIICTILGMFLFGGGAAIVIADISGFIARSTGNRLSAHVTSSDNFILLSDDDEVRQSDISNTFVADEVTYEGDIKYAGYLNVYNAYDTAAGLMFRYEDPEGQINDLADDFYVQMRKISSDGYQIVYSGTLGDFVEDTWENEALLSPHQEVRYEMYVGLMRPFTIDDLETDIEFNFVVLGDVPELTSK